MYGYFGYIHATIWPFILASIIIGLGFTFYTGAVDAWMVDALNTYQYKGKREVIFARSGIIFGISMLIGTTAGGVIGGYGLWIPYLGRALLLIPAFIIGYITMFDIGFERKSLRLSDFGKETIKIARSGVNFGIREGTVRNLMLVTLASSIFFIFGFYSWQKYFLDLLENNLIWVSGIIAALVGISQILGNVLVGPIVKRFPDRGKLITVLIILQATFTIAAALTNNFYIAAGCYLVVTTSFGLTMPIKMNWLNDKIPSSERATIISLDALFSDGGGTIGQLGLGYMSKQINISAAWLLGGIIQLAGVPAALRARENDMKGDRV
jgi:MFS family permease